jgi:hypothetical protein
MVPVRFPPELLDEVRRRAGDDDRPLSGWIRRAVEHELEFDASSTTSPWQGANPSTAHPHSESARVDRS